MSRFGDKTALWILEQERARRLESEQRKHEFLNDDHPELGADPKRPLEKEQTTPTWGEVDAIRKGKSDIDLAERIWQLERELAAAQQLVEKQNQQHHSLCRQIAELEAAQSAKQAIPGHSATRWEVSGDGNSVTMFFDTVPNMEAWLTRLASRSDREGEDAPGE